MSDAVVAAAALLALATVLEEHDTGVVPDKPSEESLKRAYDIVAIFLENMAGVK